MATIKWYNPATDEWEYVGVGSSGGDSGDFGAGTEIIVLGHD